MGFIINPYQVQPGVPAFTGILDTYTGSVAAYSVARRLATAYTGNLIRVRRSSDNAEQNIGYDSNNVLDESALTTFVGANDGFVTTIYDQSGNGKNATQTTAGNQHRIVSSGTIEKYGGKPCLNSLTRPNYDVSNTTVKNAFTVAKVDTQNFINYLLGSNNSTTPFGFLFYNGSYSLVNGLGGFDGTNINSISGKDLNRHLGYFQLKSSKLYVAKDGAAETDTGSFVSSFVLNELLGRSAGTNVYFQGVTQEIILYNSDETSNKSGIESNINTFYSIY